MLQERREVCLICTTRTFVWTPLFTPTSCTMTQEGTAVLLTFWRSVKKDQKRLANLWFFKWLLRFMKKNLFILHKPTPPSPQGTFPLFIFRWKCIVRSFFSPSSFCYFSNDQSLKKIIFKRQILNFFQKTIKVVFMFVSYILWILLWCVLVQNQRQPLKAPPANPRT